MSGRNAVERAVEAAGGSPSALAAAIGGGVLRQHVEYWLKTGRVPPERCYQLEQASHGAVSRWDLRPEDWFRIWPELIGAPGAPEIIDRPAPDEPDPERSGPNLPKSGNGPSPGMEPISGAGPEKATACGA